MKPTISACNSCKAKILWVKTKNNKNMPIDYDVKFIDDTEFNNVVGHISHFATCPNANQHRKRS